MKRYKVYFSIFNMLEDSQKEVVRLQAMWGALIGILMASTLVASDARWALGVAVVGFVVDKLLTGFWFVANKPQGMECPKDTSDDNQQA